MTLARSRVERSFRVSNESLRVSARGPALFSVSAAQGGDDAAKLEKLWRRVLVLLDHFEETEMRDGRHVRIGTVAAGQEHVLIFAEIQNSKSIISLQI